VRRRGVALRLRAGALRAAFAAPVERLAAVVRLAVERLAAGLRAADVRAAPAAEDFARVERLAVERLAVDRFAVERFAVERFAVERFAVERDELLRPALDLRAPDDDVARAPEPSSPPHLPDITRCAASATASAISEPNFVALDIMLLAAWEALSAASSPASRIARRAFGLALIAAAAAARPAASISLLIAAFANLSTVSDELDEDREEAFLGDLAIAVSPCVAKKSSLAP
jgi:NADH:ubiquinone oxidoreductase subunit K